MSKADSEDVCRILDNLLAQGNGEEVHNWMVLNMCFLCEFRNGGKKE